MKSSSITKRWVRGSLLFTLAVVLLAEGIFLGFTISGYYRDALTAVRSQLQLLSQQTATGGTGEERALAMIRTVEDFDLKQQFELMLVHANGSIVTTSSGVLPGYTEIPQDINDARRSGGWGIFVGDNERGEKVTAATLVVTNQSAQYGYVGFRLVTSMREIDRTIQRVVVASVILLLAIVLASAVSGMFFIRSIVFPLQKVEATAAHIAQGDFDIRIDNKSNDEIGSLCKTINNMADELQKSDKMKNEFISSVSHELRTPLTAIKGWTETVGKLQDPQNPNFKRGLDIIAGEADRLYGMVEDLLDFSRMQDGLKLEPELLDLAAEVEDAVLLSGQRAAGLGVALLYSIPEQPVPVMADKNRIRQVMVNVLDNAIKYSFTGGEVAVEIFTGENNARVLVKDEGQGISPEDLENVKQKFYKGKGALRGSGIGLAVVDEIMRRHGGALGIESEKDRGTTITLQLPLHDKKTGPENSEETPDGESGKKNQR